MWTWLLDHYGVVSAIASVATLGVWVLYLQLFYRSYKHQLEPKIMITRGGGHSFRSRCILTNMSPEVVFIQAVMVRLTFEDAEVTCSLSDIERVLRQGMDKRSEFFQGPLSSGEYLDLGPFEELAEAAMQNCDGQSATDGLKEMSVTAVGTYTWHDKLVAAERSFKLGTERGQRHLHAERFTARQIRSRRELRGIRRVLEEHSGRSVSRSEE